MKLICVPLFFLLSLNLYGASLPDVIKAVKPSVVGVGTYMATRRPPAALLGTGFVIQPGNLIVTNNHVVDLRLNSEKFEKLVIFTGIGRDTKFVDASLVAKSERYDLAVLKINEKLPALAIDPTQMRPEGERIAFTGFPIGAVLGLYPVTHQGIISAITPIAIPAPSSRQLNVQKIKMLRNPIEVYQLDGTAYPGNSGSPLFDAATGEVIGVINMVHVKASKEDILSKPSGIAYAIPIKNLLELLATLN